MMIRMISYKRVITVQARVMYPMKCRLQKGNNRGIMLFRIACRKKIYINRREINITEYNKMDKGRKIKINGKVILKMKLKSPESISIKIITKPIKMKHIKLMKITIIMNIKNNLTSTTIQTIKNQTNSNPSLNNLQINSQLSKNPFLTMKTPN